MSEPINFDNDSSIWNYPPKPRDLPQRVPLQYDKTPRHLPFSPACRFAGVHPRLRPHSTWCRGWRRQQKTQLQWQTVAAATITVPPSSVSSATPGSLVPPSSSTTADPLSPPLSARHGTSSRVHPPPPVPCSTPVTWKPCRGYKAGNVVLPLVHRVTGTLAATSTASPRVYTTGTIRYARQTLACHAGEPPA